MSKFSEETIQGLKEAIAIKQGEIPVKEKENMPAPTFVAEDGDE